MNVGKEEQPELLAVERSCVVGRHLKRETDISLHMKTLLSTRVFFDFQKFGHPLTPPKGGEGTGA